MIKINLNALVLLAALFPYSPNLLSFADIEPFCLVLCCLYLLVRVGGISVSRIDVVWLFAAIFSITSSALIADGLTDFRTALGGFSFVVFFLYGYVFVPQISQQTFRKLMIFFVWVWTSVSIAQFFGVGFEILSPNRTTAGRGFTAVAAEATFAALHVIFVVVLSIMFRKLSDETQPRFTKYELLAIQFPIFLHVSATALVCYLGGFVGSWAARTFLEAKRFLFVLAIVIISIFLLNALLKNAEDLQSYFGVWFGSSSLRIIQIWEYVVTGRILQDASAFDRLSSSFKFLFSPYFLPQTINHEIWIQDTNGFLESIDSTGRVNYSYRNLSGLGQLNVMLGLLFLIPLRGVLVAFFRIKRTDLYVSSLIGAFLVALFFSTSLAHPLYGIVLGLTSRLFMLDRLKL